MREHAFARMIILLIGNKDDLNTEREVSTEEGQDFAKRNNLIFFVKTIFLLIRILIQISNRLPFD